MADPRAPAAPARATADPPATATAVTRIIGGGRPRPPSAPTPAPPAPAPPSNDAAAPGLSSDAASRILREAVEGLPPPPVPARPAPVALPPRPVPVEEPRTEARSPVAAQTASPSGGIGASSAAPTLTATRASSTATDGAHGLLVSREPAPALAPPPSVPAAVPPADQAPGSRDAKRRERLSWGQRRRRRRRRRHIFEEVVGWIVVPALVVIAALVYRDVYPLVREPLMSFWRAIERDRAP